ncbi:MAG TPA: hypothetical protein VHG69_01535, partial [Thermoleophilaceae bacterium]|nr:hypothetical protein [Thermoleophilaceae bacterium]
MSLEQLLLARGVPGMHCDESEGGEAVGDALLGAELAEVLERPGQVCDGGAVVGLPPREEAMRGPRLRGSELREVGVPLEDALQQPPPANVVPTGDQPV